MSRKRKTGHVNHDRWMVSYADFVTLLFAFFVVMFASSRQDHRKTQQAETSIRTAFQTMGVFPSASIQTDLSSVVVPPPHAAPSEGDLEAMALAMEDLRNLEHRMDRALAPQIANGIVTVTLGRAGLLISLSSAGFFQSGSALPIASSLPALNEIGQAIATTPYDVRIEGHTDNVPIHNAQYSDNWELSTARATALTRLFIEKDQIVPARLSAAGYAQYHPIASNLTEEGRGRNRRVDVIVLPTRQQDGKTERVFAKQDAAITPVSTQQNPQRTQKFLLRTYHSGPALAPVTPSGTISLTDSRAALEIHKRR
ncbi:MAG: flagellar motor protein MotB [Acidobacteriaceae bacterium]